MRAYLKDKDWNYIVHINDDVCYTPDINKATAFESSIAARQYKDKWQLDDYHVDQGIFDKNAQLTKPWICSDDYIFDIIPTDVDGELDLTSRKLFMDNRACLVCGYKSFTKETIKRLDELYDRKYINRKLNDRRNSFDIDDLDFWVYVRRDPLNYECYNGDVYTYTEKDSIKRK